MHCVCPNGTIKHRYLNVCFCKHKQRNPTGSGELYEWGTVVKKRTKKRTPTTTN